jgi:hypothetical protein
MASELPEGIDLTIVSSHALSIQITGQLINLTAEYMRAPQGSGEEELKEEELSDALETVTNMPPQIVGNALLALLSLIVEVSEPAEVQEWFDRQHRNIKEAMN